MTRLTSIVLAGLLLTPLGMVAWVSLTPDAFLTPPTGDWSLRWYRDFPGEPRWRRAVVNSLVVATGATLVGLAAGVPCAVWLAAPPWPGRRLAAFVCLIPLGVPAVAVAAGWLGLTSRLGMPAQIALILAHAALGMPVVVLVVRSHLARLDPALGPAARALGAGPWQELLWVRLPLMRPALLSAAGSCWVLSFNESVVSVFLATPTTETLPAVVWPSLRQGPTPFVAVAAVLCSTAGIVLAAVAVRAFRPQRR